LIHSRDPAKLHALVEGDAFFTRLEGEWWMRFSGDMEAGARLSDEDGGRTPSRVAIAAH
jgi:hypothetical protein